jgi:hypothetical protein
MALAALTPEGPFFHLCCRHNRPKKAASEFLLKPPVIQESIFLED